MTRNAPTPSAPKQCFCRSGTMKQCDICICTCCEHQETSLGNTHLRPKEQGSAPLTHEEVEQLLAAIKERTALAREMEDSGYDEIELKTWMVIWADMYIRHLQAQLKNRTEDAERMAGALEKCKALVPDRTVDCHGDKCRLPNCEACWSTAREYVRTTAVQFIDTTLSSLHHPYTPKP